MNDVFDTKSFKSKFDLIELATFSTEPTNNQAQHIQTLGDNRRFVEYGFEFPL